MQEVIMWAFLSKLIFGEPDQELTVPEHSSPPREKTRHRAPLDVSDLALQVVARTILGEAVGESREGQEAVAWVIRNRVESGRYPDTAEGVARQPYQFSAWNDPRTGGNGWVHVRSGDAYDEALDVAISVFAGHTPDPTYGATHYYAPAGMPGEAAPYWWDDELRMQHAHERRIGNHVFMARNHVKNARS